jgi:hypothetical protein
MAKLEPIVVAAMAEIEAGNDQLSRLMNRLVDESSEFERMISRAKSLLAGLSAKVAVFPDTAQSLKDKLIPFISPEEAVTLAPLFDDLYAQYTMVSERNVHSTFAERIGIVVKNLKSDASDHDKDEDVLFF